MVESKLVLQMIPHTLFIEWNFGYYSRHCSLAVLLFTSSWNCSLAVVKLLFTYTILFMYTELFTYTILFIRPVFFFKCSFLDLFNLKFYA